LAHNGGFTLFLYNREVVFSGISASRSVHLKLKGANSEVQLQGEEPLPGVSNYFLGTDPKAWRIGIRQYAKVRYRNVYPGIDLLFRGNNGKLEFDFAVAPGADPKVISLAIRGARQNIVISDRPMDGIPEIFVAESLQHASELVIRQGPAFVIGGSALYAEALPLAEVLFLTELQRDFDGDVYFPEFDPVSWTEVSRERRYSDGVDQFAFDFVEYRPKIVGFW
jgi:Dihydrofolate reductase